MTPTFSIVHATARINGWQEAHAAWVNRAHAANFEYILAVDEDGPFHRNDPGLDRVNSVVWNNQRKCNVDAWNAGCQVAKGKILILASDDIFPPDDWDRKLLKAIGNRTGSFVVETRSGTPADERRLMVLNILSRARYEQLGYALYPEYEGMYSDDDFTEHARQDGIVIDARHLVFQHKHPIYDQTVPTDALYESHNAPAKYTFGRDILNRRRASRFGTVTTQQQKTRIAICMPGETFSATWVMHFLGLFMDLHKLGYEVMEVPPFNCYSSDPGVTRETLRAAVLASNPQPDYVLWIDDDNVVTSPQVRKLILDLETFPELQAVFGWTWIIATDGRPARPSCGRLQFDKHYVGVSSVFTPQEMYDHAAKGNLMQLGYSGFPVVLMRTSLLRNLGQYPFAPFVGPTYNWGKSGEDFAFCVRCVQNGHKIAVDPQVKVPHLKLGAYEPDVKNLITMKPPNETENAANAAD